VRSDIFLPFHPVLHERLSSSVTSATNLLIRPSIILLHDIGRLPAVSLAPKDRALALDHRPVSGRAKRKGAYRTRRRRGSDVHGDLLPV
jgi:hypothetical protein